MTSAAHTDTHTCELPVISTGIVGDSCISCAEDPEGLFNGEDPWSGSRRRRRTGRRTGRRRREGRRTREGLKGKGQTEFGVLIRGWEMGIPIRGSCCSRLRPVVRRPSQLPELIERAHGIHAWIHAHDASLCGFLKDVVVLLLEVMRVYGLPLPLPRVSSSSVSSSQSPSGLVWFGFAFFTALWTCIVLDLCALRSNLAGC